MTNNNSPPTATTSSPQNPNITNNHQNQQNNSPPLSESHNVKINDEILTTETNGANGGVDDDAIGNSTSNTTTSPNTLESTNANATSTNNNNNNNTLTPSSADIIAPLPKHLTPTEQQFFKSLRFQLRNYAPKTPSLQHFHTPAASVPLSTKTHQILKSELNRLNVNILPVRMDEDLKRDVEDDLGRLERETMRVMRSMVEERMR